MPYKKGRTKLFTSLQKCFSAAKSCRQKNIPVQEYLEQEKENYVTRRKFLQQTGKAATLTALTGAGFLTQSFSYKNKDAKIIIVGAGMAGLSAAYYLQQHGFSPVIYEASGRSGGRIFTANDIFFKGSFTELGAEFIDTGHKHLWNYIREFELETLDIFSESESKLIPLAFYFNGRHYTEKELIEAFLPLVQKITADQKKLSSRIFYNRHTPFDKEMDALSLEAYLEKIQAADVIKKVIEVAFITEYGDDIGNQSALNFLTVIGTDTSSFKYYGESDERYKVKGGNQRIPETLARKLENEILYNHTLIAINENSSQKNITLQFSTGAGQTKTVEAHRVLLTVPFTILRDIEWNFSLPENKKYCIQQVGYGKNVKLFAGFHDRPWRKNGYAGAVFTDEEIQSGWDNTQLQENKKSGFTIFTGGKTSDMLGADEPIIHIQKYLPVLNKIHPGTADTFNGIAKRMHWPTHPFSKASYLNLKPGQYTAMSGLIGEPAGNLYFAGEHCSYDYQGFMNGAAETGLAAAKKIMKSL